MAEITSEFGSDDWIPDLQELCFNVLKNLKNRLGGQFLVFRDELIGTIKKPGIIDV